MQFAFPARHVVFLFIVSECYLIIISSNILRLLSHTYDISICLQPLRCGDYDDVDENENGKAEEAKKEKYYSKLCVCRVGGDVWMRRCAPLLCLYYWTFGDTCTSYRMSYQSPVHYECVRIQPCEYHCRWKDSKMKRHNSGTNFFSASHFRFFFYFQLFAWIVSILLVVRIYLISKSGH